MRPRPGMVQLFQLQKALVDLARGRRGAVVGNVGAQHDALTAQQRLRALLHHVPRFFQAAVDRDEFENEIMKICLIDER